MTLENVYNEIIDEMATPKASFLLIKHLKEQGNPAKVIKACLRALEFFPDDISIRGILAEQYFNEGNTQLADNELSKICRQLDEFSYLFKLQADLYRKEGRYDEAIDSLRKYLTHNPDDKEAEQHLFELISHRKGDKSVPLTPTIAEIYFKQGELEEAIAIYKELVKSRPDDQQSRTRLIELEKIRREEKGEIEDEGMRGKKLKTVTILEKWLDNIGRNREYATNLRI